MKLNLKIVGAIVTIAVGLTALLDRYNAKQEKTVQEQTVQEQVQDGSAFARANRAVAWIDRNGWKLNFIGPQKP